MKKFVSSLWYRVILCVVLMLLLILVPCIIATTTRSNGLGAGIYVLFLFGMLPLSSLFAGILAAPEARKLWFLPALPTVLSWLLWPFPTDGYLPFRLAKFAGLVIGYAAFAVCIRVLNRKK